MGRVSLFDGDCSGCSLTTPPPWIIVSKEKPEDISDIESYKPVIKHQRSDIYLKNKDIHDYLNDITCAAAKIQEFTRGISSYDQFIENDIPELKKNAKKIINELS